VTSQSTANCIIWRTTPGRVNDDLCDLAKHFNSQPGRWAAGFNSKGVFQWFNLESPLRTIKADASGQSASLELSTAFGHNATIQQIHDFASLQNTYVQLEPVGHRFMFVFLHILISKVALYWLTKILMWHSKALPELSRNASTLLHQLHHDPNPESATRSPNTSRKLRQLPDRISVLSEPALRGVFWGLSFILTQVVWDVGGFTTLAETTCYAMMTQVLLSVMMVVAVHFLLTFMGCSKCWTVHGEVGVASLKNKSCKMKNRNRFRIVIYCVN
jgi:hypothetical protein